MKKLLTVVLCVIGFVLIAAPIYMKYETRQVFINGKPFSQAILINGQWFVPMKDVIGGGGVMTVEPAFKFQGTTLSALVPAVSPTEHKHKLEGSSSANTIGGTVGSNDQTQYKQQTAAKFSPGVNSFFRVRKAGEISTHIVMNNGQAFLPVADLIQAVNGNTRGGGVFNPGTLKQGDAIRLSFTVNGDGILAFQQ